MGKHTTGPAVKNHIYNVPFVVLGLSTSSSTSSSSASSTSSSQDTVVSTENPATERCEIMGEESLGNPSRGSAETKNQNLNGDDEELRRKRICWIRMFSHINTAPALLMNYRWSRKQKWYRVRVSIVSIYTNFPKDRNCDVCLRTKITKASCRRCTGTVVPNSDNL